MRYSQDAQIAVRHIAESDASDADRLAALGLFLDTHPPSKAAKTIANIVFTGLARDYSDLERALITVSIDIELDRMGVGDA